MAKAEFAVYVSSAFDSSDKTLKIGADKMSELTKSSHRLAS
jgi:hypothetical protein